MESSKYEAEFEDDFKNNVAGAVEDGIESGVKTELKGELVCKGGVGGFQWWWLDDYLEFGEWEGVGQEEEGAL